MISTSFLLVCFFGILLAARFASGGVGKPLWIFPAIGGLVFFGLIALGLLAPPTSSNRHGPANLSAIVGGLNWSRSVVFVLLFAFLAAMFARRGITPMAAHGFRHIWRGVAAIAIIAIIFLGTARTSFTVSQASNATAQVARQVSSDMRAEMDQFDAPRIPVSPDAPAAPSAPTPTAQPPVAVKASKGKTVKVAAASTNKRKKSDKPQPAPNTKQAESAAKTDSTAKATATKENSANDAKQVMFAEAESDQPKTRPDWVDESPNLTGKTRREVIAIGPYATIGECNKSIDVYLLLKAYERIQQLAGLPYSEEPLPSLTFRNGAIYADGKLMSSGPGNPFWHDERDPRIQQMSDMGIGAEYLRREIVAKDSRSNKMREFTDTVESTVGPMKMLYLQIEFTSATDRDLLRYWGTHERRERFAIVGLGAGSILGFVGLVFGLLKVDTWTKGYYSKRLFIGVPAVIIAGLLLMGLKVGRSSQLGSAPTVPLPQSYAN